MDVLRHITASCSIITMLIYLLVSMEVINLVTAYSSLDGYLADVLDQHPADVQSYGQMYPSDITANKRYARLSYNYGSRRPGSRRRYYHSRYYRSRYYRNYQKPWMNLPDTECYRNRCKGDSDCCRRYSKCDKSAHVCINCWHGHPCRSNRDCCERYSYCNKQTMSCQA